MTTETTKAGRIALSQSTNPFPYQLSDEALWAQFHALRRISDPSLVELIDLRSTLSTMIVRVNAEQEDE